MGSAEERPPTSLVRLGRRPAADDLLGLLLACHERIRGFSALAVSLATRADLPAAEVVDGCARLVRYFSEALPLHARDEEESVEPRLRGRSPALDEALRRMADEHQGHVAPLAELLEGWRALGERPDDRALRASLLPPASLLRGAFEVHLREEEARIFPHLAALPPFERDEAVRELRARRSAAL
jgi:hypothetical protein